MTQFALDEDDERFIQKQLESGRYSTASEVVQAGLEILQDFETSREHWLREEIPSRWKDIQGNPEKTAPLKEAFSRLETRHKARMATMK